MKATFVVLLFVLTLVEMPATQPAYGSFHAMQIEQVIGGVGGDTAAQAIQLRMRFAFQNALSFARLVVSDATGANPVVLMNFGSNVANSAAGSRVLITSADFANFTDVALNSDFTMQNLIPASYLAAGSLTFEDSAGFIVYWRLSWGGTGYTGPITGSITNDSDGVFSPSLAGPLPSNGEEAVQFQGVAGALSTTNANDYALTASPAVFTNNAGESFTVRIPPVPTISDWGLAVMTLLVLTTGAIVIKRPRLRPVA